MNVRDALRSLWSVYLSDWRLLWLLLLLPVVFVLPALPIDETRYLAVAWEMHNTGNYLVPHLNGAPYSHKPPMLFWLMNVSWFIAGVQVWSARLVVLAAALLSLALLQRLALRVGKSERVAGNSTWFLFGMVYFAGFSSAIMFDVLLTTCVLLGLSGVLDWNEGRFKRGTLVLALAIGLGVITKGPVVLLGLGGAVLLGPWWSEVANVQRGRWYGSVALALLGGVAVALAWALPAAWFGGEQYTQEIFFHQTVDRMSQSFAHRRPVWWYLAVVPLMVLPWTLTVRGSLAAWRAMLSTQLAARFALAWTVPPLLMFSLISGKQPHYLLPLLPGLALLLALLLEQPAARLRAGWFGLLVLTFGIGMGALPLLAEQRANLPMVAKFFTDMNVADNLLDVAANIWPLWGAAIALVGLIVSLKRRSFVGARGLAIACAVTVVLAEIGIAQAVGQRLNLKPAAAEIAAAQMRGQPIAHIGWHHAVYEFAGRLTQPLEKIDFAQLHEWSAAHPNGLVMTFYSKYPIAAAPIFQQPFRFGRIAIWRAADLLAQPDVVPPKDDGNGDDNTED